ncbi:hypothetical protein ACFQZF_10020 [Flavobacterium myungsuense]|uniref:Uncharacterized protein n=1 Tax=Flavobacterium myungsuense TaxID=651823 RepID=A0ABW3J345_9FLAO
MNSIIIENKTNSKIEIRMFFKNLDDLSEENIYFENYQIDKQSISVSKEIIPDEEIIIGIGSGIAKPVEKVDIRFDKIDILIGGNSLSFNKNAFYYCLDERTNWPFLLLITNISP